ncbi:MAG: dephospho-CoA kinase [Halothiobacillus sp.]
MSFIVGLTGGIASGKSTVTQFLAQERVPIIDTDLLSRELTAPHQPALASIAQTFGQNLITPDGTLDRAALRRIIFNDPIARAQLESILHPAIRALAYQRAINAAIHSPYVVVVVALLAEPPVTPHYQWLNHVIGIRATPELQRERLRQRPGIDTALASQILAAQSTDEQRAPLVDDWLDNTGDLTALKTLVQQRHQQLLALSKTY